MPWVTAVVWRQTGPAFIDGVKIACVGAWREMGSGPEFDQAQVGGNVCKTDDPIIRTECAYSILFQYGDRGEAFHSTLENKLLEKLKSVNTPVNLVLLPTNNWFPDPIWSQKPCQQPHAE